MTTVSPRAATVAETPSAEVSINVCINALLVCWLDLICSGMEGRDV